MGSIILFYPSGSWSDDTRAYRELSLRRWYDHVIYTRNTILSLLSHGQDVTDSINRLLKNQDDIGDLFRPFYPAAQVDDIVLLLKDHIKQAGDIITASMAGEDTATLIEKWRANCQAILAALIALDPDWAETDLARLWDEHLDLTLNELVLRNTQEWANDIVNFDRIMDNIQKISDILVDGISQQPSFGMQKASVLASKRTF